MLNRGLLGLIGVLLVPTLCVRSQLTSDAPQVRSSVGDHVPATDTSELSSQPLTLVEARTPPDSALIPLGQPVVLSWSGGNSNEYMVLVFDDSNEGSEEIGRIVFAEAGVLAPFVIVPADVLARAHTYRWVVDGFDDDAAVGGDVRKFMVLPTCLADFNFSGAINTNDLFAFLDAWFAGV